MATKRKKNVARLKIVALAAKIDVQKAIIAGERDTLRELYSELEDLVSSLDSTVDSLESGLREIQRGIDTMSEYV